MKCKPFYKNLGEITDFGEQVYVTTQLLQQICENDEFLKQFCDRLNYLTPPAVRKSFNPANIDELNSYGFSTGALEGGNSIIKFGVPKEDTHNFDLYSKVDIDTNKSDCEWEGYDAGDGNPATRAIARFEEVEDTVEVSTNTKHPYWGTGVNSYWPVCWDSAKPYYVRGAYLKDETDPRIPAIARAQTFKVKDKGVLHSVTLAVQNTGEMTSSWGSALTVQIWPTKTKEVKKTIWNKKTKKSEYVFITAPSNTKYNKYKKVGQSESKKGCLPYNGDYYKKDNKNGTYIAQRETIYVPKGNMKKPLAQASFQPDKTTPGYHVFKFKNKIKVKKNEHYAIVVFSPLSHPDHCPRIGGWGRNCNVKKYNDGDAFLSTDNCRTWKRYGNNNDQLTKEEYSFGLYAPQDFAFECKITNTTVNDDEYITNTPYYVYTMPIMTNPIRSFHISGSADGEAPRDLGSKVSVDFEYSTNGRTWHPLEFGEVKTFSTGNEPIMLMFRAIMETTDVTVTPALYELNCHYSTVAPTKMYVRTKFYDAKTNPMLGASEWGRVFAPFELTPSNNKVDCTVEIIEKQTKTDKFTITSVSDIESVLETVDKDGYQILNESAIVDIDPDDIYQYLIRDTTIIPRLREAGVWIKPYKHDDTEDLMSFDGGKDDNDNQLIYPIHLEHSPAYPIQECVLHPEGNTPEQSFGEWCDYLIDYDEDTLTFYYESEDEIQDFFAQMQNGSLEVSYNPRFIRGLTNDEVGVRFDEETGKYEEGFILDYIKEQITVSASQAENRRVTLKCNPVDPVREIVLNKDSSSEIQLYEGKDFDVDSENKAIVFRVQDDMTGESAISNGDTLDIVYTPDLTDTGIALGYYASRTDMNYDCKILPNYIEYKS